MDENVALDSTKQKKFAKSIKGIKKLLKKKDVKSHKPAVLAPNDGEEAVDKRRKKRKERGLVYLSHIPHGFYEHQMTQYFKQFGMVTNVRVIRSPRTGRSKGFAFVEFREPAVAEIVAETMNNYLMGKRLIKAVLVPPEKQKRSVFRKHWNSENNPTAEARRKLKKVYNANKDEAGDLQKAKNLYKMLQNKNKKFSALGISIDFFQPVDVPKALLENKAKQESKSDNKVKVEDAKKKKTKFTETVEKPIKKEKKTEIKIVQTEIKSKKEIKKEEETKKLKQKEKERKLKDSGMKLPENFIQIQPESGEESDSSVEFDSDEYEKMLADDSDGSSGDESDDENEDDEEDDVDDSEDEDEDDESGEEELPPIPVKVQKGKKPVVAPPPQQMVIAKLVVKNEKKPQVQQKQGQSQQAKKPQVQNQVQKKVQPQKHQHQGPAQKKPQAQGQKQNKPQPVGQTPQHDGKGIKRKNTQPEVSPKKLKFEKQDKKHRNKQFKKKNKAN